MTSSSIDQLDAMANHAFQRGDYAAARELFWKLLAALNDTVGPEHPRTAQTMHNLGFIASRTGNAPDARRFFERALEIQRKTLGPGHPQVAVTLRNLGLLEQRQGDLARAWQHFADELDIWKGLEQPPLVQLSGCLHALGEILAVNGDLPAARRNFSQALQMRELVLQHADGAAGDLEARQADVADSHAALGMLCVRLGEADWADHHLRQALAFFGPALGPDHWLTRDLVDALAALPGRP